MSSTPVFVVLKKSQSILIFLFVSLLDQNVFCLVLQGSRARAAAIERKSTSC